jgi:glycerophosphoryl diester phosphodiesterase
MKSGWARLSVGLAAVLLLTYLVLVLLARSAGEHAFEADGKVLVIAHRGGRHLWPENTLYAFERAWEMGVDVLEMDLHGTADGALVLMHDKTVDRTTNGSGAIQDHSLAELQALDAGYRWTADDGVTFPFRGMGIKVPTLDEVFEALPEALMNIEIKQSEPSIVEPFCQAIREHGMEEQVLIASFDQPTIIAFRQACPDVATTAGEDEVRLLYMLGRVYLDRAVSAPAEVVQVPQFSGETHVTIPRFVQAARGRNMEVHVWTVNETEELQEMLDLGVDGIITDYPDRLLALLGRQVGR